MLIHPDMLICMEQFEEEHSILEQVPDGPELTAFLTERFGWQFRSCVQCELAEPNALCQSAIDANPNLVTFLSELRRHYTERILIIDGFNKDHNARRAFYRQVLGPKEPWVRAHSKLRVNFCTMIPSYMEMIIYFCQEAGVHLNFDLTEVSALQQSSDQYKTWDLETKIDFVTKIDGQICAFFRAMSQATSLVAV